MRFILYITIYFYLCFKSYASYKIEYIFIESRGNNIYEAQVIANHLGMQRALSIVANKFNIDNFNSSKISYTELKDIFTSCNIIPHNVQDNFYQGEISYEYDKYKIINFFLNKLKDKNTQCIHSILLIPIFKSNQKLYFADAPWHEQWESEISKKLNDYKVYYPFFNKEIELKLANIINYQNLFSINYKNFINLFPDILFNKVVLAIGEYFSDDKGVLHFKITEKTLNNNLSDNIIINNYHVEKNNEYDKTKLWSKIAEDIIQHQGIKEHVLKDSKNYNSSNLLSEEIQKLESFNDNPPVQNEKTMRTITMHADAYSEQEIDKIKQKINNISGIFNLDFQIFPELNSVNITFNTNLDNAMLAESFYTNNLSYSLEGENDFILLDCISKPTNKSGI